MTYWLSWGRTLLPRLKSQIEPAKHLIKEIFLPVLIFILIGLFWLSKSLGQGSLNNVFAVVLFLGSMYWYLKKREESTEFLIFLSAFLGFFTLYNIQFVFFVPSWIAEILVFIFTLLIFTYLAYEKNYLENSLLFGIGLSVCILQIFFILSFWRTNPLSKSFIITALFYGFWFIVVKKEKILPFTVIIVLSLILVIATTRWPVI
ncbi:MAG: hypothetical protein NT135_00815 [Candidatus Berkelbacteria bacterium]|nr:hypothetical protein [Candidatus Berkelbacteria bacterium]